MSLQEVTNRCFQNGISEQKWATLCQHVIRKDLISEDVAGTEISNCVLELFGIYPADVLLLSYLKHALTDNLLMRLSTFVEVFLEAAKSPDLHDSATVTMLCRLVQEEFFATGLPAEKVLLRVESTASQTLKTIHDALDLLKTAYTLPVTPFHNPTSSASMIVRFLLSCVGDLSTLSTSEAMVHYANVVEVMQLHIQLDSDLRASLENFSLSLSMAFGDDAKMAQEAQMMHSLQMSLGKGDILGANSQTDLVTCSLILRHLVENRSTEGGSATPAGLVLLEATFRWTSWTPKVFYTQIFLAAVSILAQCRSSERATLLWRSFVITRLPHLLEEFEKTMHKGSETIPEAEWRNVLRTALFAIHTRTDLLAQCDAHLVGRDADDMHVDYNPDSGSRSQANSVPFFQLLVQYCAQRTNLMDVGAKTTFRAIAEPRLATILTGETLDSSAAESQIEERLSSDISNDEQLSTFLTKGLTDTPNHPQIARVIRQKVERLCKQNDVEGLGSLCKALNSVEMITDIISLHVNLREIVAFILAFVEDFDCETVGDPQTAVGHLGHVVLFLQDVIVKYQLFYHTFQLDGRVLPTQYLLSTSNIPRRPSIEEQIALKAWQKSLFDQNSEGIEDSILRSTKPKLLLKLAGYLVMQPSLACARHQLDEALLKNGISYFTGSLLNWTLVGVIKALVREILERDLYAPAVFVDVIHMFVDAPTCPQIVLKLAGHGLIALADHPKASTFDSGKMNNIRAKASAALKLPAVPDPALNTLTIQNGLHWLDQPRKAIHDAMTLARTGRAPAFDVGRCVSILGPTRFIRLLWTELVGAAQVGDMELARRLATYILTCPPAEVGPGAGRTPPLLPIFLTSGIQYIIARLDGSPPTEQTLGTELLVVIITSSLQGLLHFEWAIRHVVPNATAAETPSYRSAVTLGRRLAADLKRHKSSPSAGILLQRMGSSSAFVANFPMFTA